MQKNKIIVVGAGPAGMMAAIRSGQLGQDVTLIEKKSSLGSKLLLSGKGRCNLTNSSDLNTFLKRFSKNGEFLRDAFKLFFNLDLIKFFESGGLKLKVERQLRVFPVTDSSASILGVLRKALEKNKVNIIYKEQLKDIVVEAGRVKGIILDSNKAMPADKVILATGGVSYGFTGSTGEGLNIAKGLGHTIVPLRPGLVPLMVKQGYVKRLEGLTLKNIRLSFGDGKKEVISDIGELLFTANGISGPLVLTLSGKIGDWAASGKDLSVLIDLKPALTETQLNERILREFKANPKKSLKNILKSLLPLSLIGLFLEILKIESAKLGNQITQEERKKIVYFLKNWRMEIRGTLPIEEAMLTLGGVSLKEVNPRTMESRLVRGLYFAGEMLDIDADTGGFNLQAAFSTGYLAGESSASSAQDRVL